MMNYGGKNIIVTGGAGLVGSSIIPRLIDGGAHVWCIDNLTLGTEKHLETFSKNKNFKFEKWDVSREGWHAKLPVSEKFETIFHLAANSDISLGHARPEMDCARTFRTTFETLQAARALKISNFIFSSTSAVYGDTNVFPTPEELPRMIPVSIYGAGKLASENFISAFSHNYGLKSWIYRFGNVVGEKLTHGVIYDFVRKLVKNPAELEVLGNGTQHKTYIDVEDCVGGMLLGFEKARPGIFNLSSEGATTVRAIAEEAVKVVTGGKAKIKYGSSNIGWVGDVPKTSLEISRMTAVGWIPKKSSDQAVFEAIQNHYSWSKSVGNI